MPLDNFRFFAMSYLNDWCSDDSRFVRGLEPGKPTSTRLTVLCEAAKYYKVTRTLPTIEGEERLRAALDAIDGVAGPLTDATVDDAVVGLATRFQQLYGRYAISAASKFLWLRHRLPAIILDDRASKFLWQSGSKFDPGDYSAYRRDWRRLFAVYQQDIDEGCDAVIPVKEFTLAWDMPDGDLKALMSEPWFRERVFDKFLWWNSDD